jgi:Ran GTPase-activating protein (RanGAP) involved in mRNA processing and transport
LLDLSRNAVGPEGIAAICGSKLMFENLVELDLSFCLIESDGAAIVASAIRESRVLRKLDLSGNHLGSYGVGTFAVKGLQGNVSLRHLVLDNNSIDDEGVATLVAGLGMHPSLVELSLADNDIGPGGLDAISSALSKEALSLHVLKLGTNFIQKDGVTILATLLSKNKTLIELDVSNNALGGSKLDSVIVLSKGFDGIISLAESLMMNATLLSLNLKGNNVSKNGMRAFSDAIASNKVVCRLLFDEADHVEQLDGGFKRNTSITDVGCEMPSSIAGILFFFFCLTSSVCFLKFGNVLVLCYQNLNFFLFLKNVVVVS